MSPQINIPFLKFEINPKEIENLELIKFEETIPEEPEYYYLFRDNSTRERYYCVLYHDGYEGRSGAGLSEMLKFAGTAFSRIEEIKPKHTDWFQTCILARVS